jgi:Bacterial membrane protein YfhO
MDSLNHLVKTPLRHALLVVLFFSVLFVVFFAPVLFYGLLLAPGGGRLGDAVLYHLAFFQSSKLLWDGLLANGFPMIADPQVMAWYPPALLLSLVPGTWNVFVISAYVMASCFAYGYVYTLTRSRFASLIAGTSYGMCGFMMAHLGHTAMIHSAVWLPLIVWSIEKLREKIGPAWLTIGCLGVTCCTLAGHLQIVTYTLLLSGVYGLAMGWRAPVGRLRFYLANAFLFALGVGMAALQILPTLELAGLSTRVSYSYADFVTYSLPLKHLLLMFFPAVFGGLQRYGPAPYFGEWNLTEMASYAGLLPLLLAVVGVIVSRRNRVAIFWAIAGLIALLLALGDQTPLSQVAYRLPALGKFRAPARHVIEMSFAISVLAGVGAATISRQSIKRRIPLISFLAMAGIMLAGVAVLSSHWLVNYAAAKGVTNLPAPAWSNPAIVIPVVILFIAGAAVLYWHSSPASLLRQGLLWGVLLLDLASFGWFYNWHDYGASKNVVTPPAFASRYRDQLRQTNQRMLSARGTLGATSELPPNLSRLWDVPNATGYSPLTLGRVTDLMSMLPDGSVAPRWQEPGEQGFNLAAVRYLFLPKNQLTPDAHGVSWHSDNMDLWLGAGCDHEPKKSLKFKLLKTVSARGLGVVSRLACSVPMANGTEVARVVISDATGPVHTSVLVAGRDTSEWSYDCPSIKSQIKHNRSEVFSSFPSKMYEEPCEGHFYRTFIDFSGTRNVQQVEIEWIAASGAMTIDKVTVAGENTESVALNSFSLEGSPWSFVEDAGEAEVYENQHDMPRAWLVHAVKTLKPDDILKAIKTSRLPDGSVYDPRQLALVEEPITVASESDSNELAILVGLSDRTMSVSTTSKTPAFLVTSDTHYPGWEVTIDGNPARLFLTNYALRGVAVPAGQHLVRFEYKPKTFYVGLLVSFVSLLGLSGLAGILRKFPKTIHEPTRS